METKNCLLLKLFVFILLSVTTVSCADLKLPSPAGKYSVGTRAIEICDNSRKMFRDQNKRKWMVQVFYPSEKHHDLNSYMPETLDDGYVQGIKILSHAKLNAEFAKNKKFPVIIFIPGLGGERQKYTILCQDLASHGYVVLSLDQPYVSNFVKFKDGTRVVLAFKDAWKLPRDRDYRYKYYDDAMAEAIKDITYMLDNLDELNNKELDGIMNKESIILMGHSFGGNVAHTLGFKDERIKAIVDIDSKITERKIFGRVGVPSNSQSKPVLFIRGMMQYQEDVGSQLTKISNATIWSPNVQHSAFSDNAYFAAKIKDFGKNGFFSKFLNWLFKWGPHWDFIDTDLGGKDVNSWFVEYRKYVVKWLKNNANS